MTANNQSSFCARFTGCLVAIALLLTPAHSLTSDKPATKENSTPERPDGIKRRVVLEGIAIEMEIAAVAAQKRLETLQAGDDVAVRFRITDTATGTPLRGAHPAAWMDLQRHPQTRDCKKQVESFINGGLFSRPEIDLNTYYALAMNQDATITVVDPLFHFGGTKLLAMILLNSPGYDWALTSDQSRLFVSMPDSNQVAVVDCVSWKVITNLDVGPRASRLALQPDEQYLWVAYGKPGAEESGIAVITTAGLKVVARIPTGKGEHEIAFSDDDRFAFVTNRDDSSVSLIDVRALANTGNIRVANQPVSIAFSRAAKVAYVTSKTTGTISAIDGSRCQVISTSKAEPGLGQIKFSPGGRLGFVVNGEKNLVHILDASTGRIVQTADVGKDPDQINFSDTIAYVRHRGSEIVLMIPLDQVGAEGKPVPVVDFPAGQNPFGKVSQVPGPSPADGIVQAPGANAVLVANPADKTIYYYKEGMAAPMGNFSNYGKEPRAVLIVDRSIKEKSAGVYETTARLKRAGIYDVALFLDSPRVISCFEAPVSSNPERARDLPVKPVNVESLITDRTIRTGEETRLQFRLKDPVTNQVKSGLRDVQVLTFLSPGVWQQRQWARQAAEGIYEISFVPPQSGIYYVYLACASVGLKLNNPQYLVLEARPAVGGSPK